MLWPNRCTEKNIEPEINWAELATLGHTGWFMGDDGMRCEVCRSDICEVYKDFSHGRDILITKRLGRIYSR